MEKGKFKAVFSELKTDDLREYGRLANEELKRRKEVRAKELWENVIAAILKYEAEIEDAISVFKKGINECAYNIATQEKEVTNA